MQITDPRLTLLSYAESRNLPAPKYTDMPTKDRNIYSSVTVSIPHTQKPIQPIDSRTNDTTSRPQVNSQKFSSYPQEARTKDEAERLAAQKALDKLMGTASSQPQSVTHDRPLVSRRVLDIVNSHPNGLFETKVAAAYVKLHGEGLPGDWLRLVENLVTIEAGANNMSIVRSQSGSSVPALSPVPVVLTEPEPLKLDKLEEFWLHVYVVYSTTDIWGVIIDDNHSVSMNLRLVDGMTRRSGAV